MRWFRRLRGLLQIGQRISPHSNPLPMGEGVPSQPLQRRSLSQRERDRVRGCFVSVSGIGALSLAACAISPCIAAPAPTVNDYPTEARADYVFGCMKANGDTRTALTQCSCSIDLIASILPYDRYVEAEAVLSLAQVPGRFGAMFRSTEPANAAVNDMRRAQAEAEVRCF
jgi:hypothetical protein